ncbi:LysR substrate-binding domain-containing protein [uncultured Tateyamaria sp.]|uniref:LysR substrate-binding domain-containing protein n=1 Tax=uncultured Tateyamaria sp. TaxID=455651 RepID=UPI002615F013|nr:LysR substrate-binding domain-containing protein [uncultured Tateyamaria sp.]
MQRPEQVSLNAIRVFGVVAECGSFKLAAARLSVTPGAVSRQILNLEASMGVQLFNRSNNAIRLTDAGNAFLRQSRPGLHILIHAVETAMGDGQDITVQVPTTLTTRWLIPLLGDFKTRWPDITVRVETNDATGLVQSTRADVTVAYFPIGDAVRDAEVLIEDRCRPYLAPNLLSQVLDHADLSSIPALQCTSSNWDWKAWLQNTTTPDVQLCYGGHFDLDDVALRAAISGMGMVLASEFIIRDDLGAGRLCALPGTPEVLLGHYTLHTSRNRNAAADVFARWLRATVQVWET